ncbi:MAG: hypothetical protein C6I00_01200 [Nitratiruptor sp.]|nr:hypothetical protein [Nitratiruptor sp.]NPA83212.1 hypothetical protein [Campylobacterota bacterium]
MIAGKRLVQLVPESQKDPGRILRPAPLLFGLFYFLIEFAILIDLFHRAITFWLVVKSLAILLIFFSLDSILRTANLIGIRGRLWLFSLALAATILIDAFLYPALDPSQEPNTLLLLSYLLILVAIPYLLLVFAYNHLDRFFTKIFKFQTYTLLNHDLYTNRTDRFLLLQKRVPKLQGQIFFLITPLIAPKSQEEEGFIQIKRAFIRLIHFWYAHEFEKVQLWATLPLFAIVLSAIAFAITLFILDSMEFPYYENVTKMILATIFLTILYISMLYHINTLLNPKYYLWQIDRLFRRLSIKFKGPNQRQKVLLFLDKNFLIEIYDTKSESFLTLNSSRAFERFILFGKLDRAGRNNVVNIFVSLFMVLYLTIFSIILQKSPVDRLIERLQEQGVIHLLEKGIGQ